MKSERLKKFKNQLYKFGSSETIRPGSLVSIILLDIFVLIIIFTGLNAQTDLLTRPQEFLPGFYYRMIVEKDWIEQNRTDRLQDIVLEKYRYSPFHEEYDTEKLHPDINAIAGTLESIVEDKELLEVFEYRERLQKIKAEKTADYNSAREDYETGLLEKVLDPDSGIESAELRYKAIQNELINLEREISATDENIDSFSPVVILWDQISAAQQNISSELLTAYDRKMFYFPLVELLFQLMFLIPLLAILIFWNMNSLKKKRKLQLLISSHLIIVTMIPVLYKFLDSIIEIIPETLLKDIIDFLSKLKLVSLWYYFLIVLCIALTVLAVFLFQRRAKYQDRISDETMKKRFLDNKCISCGKKIKNPGDEKYCIYCGANQYVKCGNCGEDTSRISSFCRNCGAQVDKI